MQKLTKDERAKKELQERLKKSAQRHSPSPLDSNPLIAQARAMLKPNFGIGSSDGDERIILAPMGRVEPVRVVQGAESGVGSLSEGSEEPLEIELTSNELASNELASNELASNELASNELASNELASNELASNELASNELAFNELASNELASNELASNELASNGPGHPIPVQKIIPSVGESTWIEAAHRLFALNSTHQDFAKPEDWVQAYLIKTFGMKRYLSLKLYLDLYKRSQNSKVSLLNLNRNELAKALETSSNSSVTRAIKWGVEMGLFESVSLTCKKGVLSPGTYFKMKFPWIGSCFET